MPLWLAFLLAVGGCDAVLDLKDPKLRDDSRASPSVSCDNGARDCDNDAGRPPSRCQDGECPDGSPCESDEPDACMGKVALGEICDQPGANVCATSASGERLHCDAESLRLVVAESCDRGEACDRSDGSCKPLVATCVGRKPGEVVCDGNTRHVCGEDLTTSAAQTCKTPQHCAQATGPDCAACIEGEHRCEGARLERCNDGRTGFTPAQTCANAAECNALVGECTSAPCRANQAVCDGDQLLLCNADQTGFDPPRQCDSGRCNAPAAQCDLCGGDSCMNVTTRLVCSGDRLRTTEQPCPDAEPHCIGDGNCVECRTRADCPAPASECEVAACSSSSCEVTRRREGTLCNRGAGLCDAAGACVPLGPPTIASIAPARGLQGLAVDATIRGTNLRPVEAVGFGAAPGLTMTVDEERRAGAEVLPVVIAVGEAVVPGMYRFSVTTPGGVATSEPVFFEVVYQPLLALMPASGPVGTRVLIQAKPGVTIHDTIAAGMPADGTIVRVSEDGDEAVLPATVRAPVGGGQVVEVTIPERLGRWADTERVSIVLEYAGPGGPTRGMLEFVYAP